MKPTALLLSLILLVGLVAQVSTSSADEVIPGLPPPPAGWPSTLQLGMSDGANGASTMRQTAPFGFRYQYLAGGVRTESGGWANWNPDGTFVSNYVQESVANQIIPVFTYYMLRQSAPGASDSDDAVSNMTNLQDAETMSAYWEDVKLFFQRAAGKDLVVLHVEPDLWGFIQIKASGDRASTVPAYVGSSGVPELAGLPDDAAGFAQAFVRLRDRYASNVSLAYHVSIFGTGEDPLFSNPSLAHVDRLAARSADFYESLGANFDVVFMDASDRDAGFRQYVYNDGGASWWDEGDYTRNIRFVSTFTQLIQKRMVLWQIPLGNTRMSAMNNTWNHYQDNHVEWLLEDTSKQNLSRYAVAGVVALLFGRGADGATCACDSNQDGVTNFAPINGNTGTSDSADDDGGFFRYVAANYYANGVLLIGEQSAPVREAAAIPIATATPRVAPAATATPAPVCNPIQGPYGPFPGQNMNQQGCTPQSTTTVASETPCDPGTAIRTVVERDSSGRLTIKQEPC